MCNQPAAGQQTIEQPLEQAIDHAIAQHVPDTELPPFVRDALIAIANDAQSKQDTAPRRDPRTTEFGTPAAHSWTGEWLESVNQRAKTYGRPICGARTPAGTPCTASPTHENGRCPHHGGFDLTGAPKGNRNAIIHGLYARRIQTCGPHCPLFASCPLGQHRPGGPVTNMPDHERPRCPYEQAEYNATLNDAIFRTNCTRNADPLALHLAHDIATLRIMTTRSLAVLANSPLIETTEAHSETYHATTTKPATALTAYLRISAEFRRYLELLEAESPKQGCSNPEYILRETRFHENDTSLHPDDQIQDTPKTGPRYTAAQYAIDEACHQARRRDESQLRQAYQQALQLAPQYAISQHPRILRNYPPPEPPTKRKRA